MADDNIDDILFCVWIDGWMDVERWPKQDKLDKLK